MNFIGKWVEMRTIMVSEVTRPRKTNITCFLVFVDVNMFSFYHGSLPANLVEQNNTKEHQSVTFMQVSPFCVPPFCGYENTNSCSLMEYIKGHHPMGPGQPSKSYFPKEK